MEVINWKQAIKKYLTLLDKRSSSCGESIQAKQKEKNDGMNLLQKSVFTGKLNPQFVEWSMGYQKDWTKIEESELNS